MTQLYTLPPVDPILYKVNDMIYYRIYKHINKEYTM